MLIFLDEFKKRFLAFSSHVICFGLAINLFYIFLCAFFNGNRVVIYVNNFGEASMELFLFPLTLGFCMVGLWFAWCFLKKAMKKDG